MTAADEETEAFILAELAKLAPGVPVIAEEEAAAGRVQTIGARFFLVDPLDGTKEFITRNGEFTVNIARDRERRAGARRRLCAREGAIVRRRRFRAARSRSRRTPHALPDFSAMQRIAARKAPKDGLIAVASRSHRDHLTDEYLMAYPVKEFVTAGSSLKFCLVAAGEADIYPRHGRTMEWDTAAGHAVLAAAGGSVTTVDGRPFVYGKVQEKFANPFFVARGRG